MKNPNLNFISKDSYDYFVKQLRTPSYDVWNRTAGIIFSEAQQNQSKKPVLYFDMDGVLAKWQTVKEDGTPIVFDEDILPAEKHYYRTLPPNKLMCALVNELCLDNNYEVRILSKATHTAIQDKLLWLQDNIPNMKMENVILVPYVEGVNKSDFIPYINGTTILFDDYTPNQIEFEQAGGVAVNILNGINRYDCRFVNLNIDDVCSLEELRFDFNKCMDKIKGLNKDDMDNLMEGRDL